MFYGGKQTTSNDILDVLDSTSQHKSHVYSSNCKICTKSIAENKSNIKTDSSILKNKSPTKQSKKDKVSPESINRTQPIRVRVEHESTSKFLQNVVKLSDKLLLENPSTSANSLNTDSSSSDAATTPVLTSPKEAITEQNSIL